MRLDQGQAGASLFESVLHPEPPLGGLSGRSGDFVDCKVSWRYIASGDQQILKAHVDTPDFIDHALKSRHKPYKGNLAQGYLSGDMYLRLRVFWDNQALGREIGKQYAILQIHDPARVIQNEISLDNMTCESGERTLSAYGDEFHMFVDVRQVEEGPENLVASVIRPCPEYRVSQVHDEFCEFASRLRLRIVGNPARIVIPVLPLGAFQLDEVVVCSI